MSIAGSGIRASIGWMSTCRHYRRRRRRVTQKLMAGRLIELNESAVDREIVFSRVFDAPRSMVWEAWTDPKQFVLWWGLRGFSTTIDEMDVRPGGVWKLV